MTHTQKPTPPLPIQTLQLHLDGRKDHKIHLLEMIAFKEKELDAERKILLELESDIREYEDFLAPYLREPVPVSDVPVMRFETVVTGLQDLPPQPAEIVPNTTCQEAPAEPEAPLADASAGWLTQLADGVDQSERKKESA